MTPERVTMETEETNTSETPEIHYRDFQIESGNTEAWTKKQLVLLRETGEGYSHPELFLVSRKINIVRNKVFLN